MPLVNVMVNGRSYTVACDAGEEEHLKELAVTVDAKVRELLGSVGQVGDQRLILMAALLLADECHAAANQLEVLRNELVGMRAARDELGAKLDTSESSAADTLESAAKRIEDIADKLRRA